MTVRLVTCGNVLFPPFIPYAVNCMWDEWKIGDCSITCGEGTRNNTRTQRIVAQFGGDECDGATWSVESCIEHACPGMKLFPFRNLKSLCILVYFRSKQHNLQ